MTALIDANVLVPPIRIVELQDGVTPFGKGQSMDFL